MELHLAFRLLLAFAGAIFGIIATLLFRELQTRGDTAMAKFKLKPHEAVVDFELLLSGTVLMLMGFFSYFMGGLLEVQELLTVGRLMSIGFAIVPIATFYRWWRRL